MKLNEDYVVTANEIKYKDYDVLATLKIITGPYKDVEFHFGEIHINENEEKKECSLSFNYDIISDHKQLEGNQDFEVVLESIMNDVLLESLNAAEERYKNELREKNTEAPDS
jgi:hypothetical protein